MKKNICASVYQYLFTTIQRNGYPPTLQEIAANCGLNETQLIQSLNQLEQEGRISHSPQKTRGLRITELDWRWYREDQISRFIQTHIQEHQVSPTIFEIAKSCGLSTAMVMDCLSHQQCETIAQTINDISLLATA